MDAFASPDFNPNDYAHAILAPTASGGDDISIQLAKLNFGIDDVASQLKNLVTDHHEPLLQQTAGIGELEHSLRSVRGGLDEVTNSLEKCALVRANGALAHALGYAPKSAYRTKHSQNMQSGCNACSKRLIFFAAQRASLL